MNYKSKRWKRLREKILRRDGYMCQVSKRQGRMVEANTVHHIFPVEDYPEYMWSEWNLISLSSEQHNFMHDRGTRRLTEEGRRLLVEKAEERGIKVMDEKTTLVIGLPASGKTTYVSDHIGPGICYDLDALAAAVRLTTPHAEYHKGARRLANDLLPGFIDNAHDYARDVFIIRTAPTLSEIKQINPDAVVVCTIDGDREGRGDVMDFDVDAKIRRIDRAARWAEENSVEIIFYSK